MATSSRPSISTRRTWTSVVAGGGDVLADIVGPDRQLAVAAVDEDGKLDALGAAEVDHGVEGGADRPAGEEDVVDEDDALAGDVEGDVAGRDLDAGAAGREVVAVEADVEDADGQSAFLDLLNRGGDAAGEGTPRVRMPMITRSRVPRWASTISWAMRTRARCRSSAVMRTRSGIVKEPPITRMAARTAYAVRAWRGVVHHRLPFRPRGTGLKGQVTREYRRGSSGP